MNTTHSYMFEGVDGMREMQYVMKMFRFGFKTIGRSEVMNILEHGGKPVEPQGCRTIEYLLADGSSVVIQPSDTEPKITVSISVSGGNPDNADAVEKRVSEDIENIIYIDQRAAYCCE